MKRFIKTAVSVATCGLLAFGTAMSANAVELNKTATLVVHKHAQTDKNGVTPGNGAETTVDAPGIDGVKFQIERVKEIDLNTNAGWEKAQEVVKASPNADKLPSGYTFDTAVSDTTNNGGIVRFVNQPIGLYRVTEVSGPPNVQTAAPFWVTLPMSDPAKPGEFMYTVHAYPKNTVHNVEKAVADATATSVGQDLTYTITAPTTKQTPESVEIQDQLDTKVSYKSAKVMLGTTTLAETTDYTLTHENGLVTVKLTAEGIKKYVKSATDKPLDKLTLNVVATVKQAGEIVNSANLLVNGGKVKIKSNEVVSKYGAIKVNKTDKDTGAGIDGVEFEVWAGATNDVKAAKKITINGKDKFVTANGGKLDIDGLRYSGFADGAEIKDGDPKYLHYFLVETKPAPGYNALVEPVHFIVDKPLASAPTLEVKNTKPHPLPLTGAGGIFLLLLSGGLLVAGSTALYAKTCRVTK